MECFETIIIFDTKTNEEIIKAEIRKFRELLQSWSTRKIVKLDEMGKKKLAYPIKGNPDGYYAMFIYESDASNIAELERLLRINDHVLKFLTVKLKHDELSDDLEEYVPDSDAEESEQVSKKSSHPVDVFDIIFGIE